MNRYLVSAQPSGDTFVTDGTHYSDALYYTEWREEDSYELRPDLDLYNFDLADSDVWDSEPELRYIAEQRPGEPIHRLDR